ncbi:MAG: hypothetical protein OXL36_10845 [Bryobacterales bacterium]|nr:hypothetical protein [Bryobacterales bacterium]
MSFVGGDHPDRHPSHFAPSERSSPPRLPQDFHHGPLAVTFEHFEAVAGQSGKVLKSGCRFKSVDLHPRSLLYTGKSLDPFSGSKFLRALVAIADDHSKYA